MKKPEKPIAPKKPGKFSKQSPSETLEVECWRTPPGWANDVCELHEIQKFHEFSDDEKKKFFLEYIKWESGVESEDDTYGAYTYSEIKEMSYQEIDDEFYYPGNTGWNGEEMKLSDIISKIPKNYLDSSFIRTNTYWMHRKDTRVIVTIGYRKPNENYDQDLKQHEADKKAHEKLRKEYTAAYKKHREALALYREAKSAYDIWRAKRIAELEASGEL
jgi:hypothetical protein